MRDSKITEKTILNHLYEMRHTVMFPPDPRLTCSGIADTLFVTKKKVSHRLEALKEKGFVISARVGRLDYYKITLLGIREVEKYTSVISEGEVSSSRIGFKRVKRNSFPWRK